MSHVKTYESTGGYWVAACQECPWKGYAGSERSAETIAEEHWGTHQ